ncbi:SWIM-type domain-containing protein [Nephila pilipes]|uniref:SWIM-type domain-containing protein n=1 Tax=Nephila pilipes TaxID=299642 RepID=A0A8X6P7Z4_NEPPI|nr:SWIM-type domain-containing protein [Nephila pilipes]
MADSTESRPLILKAFSVMDIYKYSERFSKQAGNRSILTKLRKGLKLFQNKFASSISFSEPEFQGNGYFTILNARCTCPAERAPAFCKHTFSLLHAIDDYIRKEMFSAPSERLQTWHQPNPTKKDPTKASQLFKCRCTKASTLDSNKFAFKKVTGIFATPFAESSISLYNIRQLLLRFALDSLRMLNFLSLYATPSLGMLCPGLSHVVFSLARESPP